MEIKKLLEKAGITPDPLKDQFFLTDDKIIKKMVAAAKLGRRDVVLEIGAGVGNLTEELAKSAGHVIAFEIDTRFKLFLRKPPKNVEVNFENAWDFVRMHGKFRKKKIYNKIVSNLPYSFIEPFLHNLTFVDYDKAVLLVPVRFLKKTQKWGVFGSFFLPKALFEVPRESFYPIPRSNSVVIELIKFPDPIKSRNLGRFLRQYMYQHEAQLVKNSLMEGLIKYNRYVNLKKLTKNEARETIKGSGISTGLLESYPSGLEIYELVEEKFS